MFESGILIAAFSIFAYTIMFLNLFPTLILEILTNDYNIKYGFYLILHKALLSMYAFIMIVISINLLRGIVKKSLALVSPWLLLSFSILAFQVTFLLNQLMFWVAYSYTEYSPLLLSGVFTSFGLHTFCIRKIFIFYIDLYRDNVLKQEQVLSIKNSTLNSQKYVRNLLHNDPSLLVPLNEEELTRQYKNSSSVNLNTFDI